MSLRIVQTAPPWTGLPPATYDGAELMVDPPTEELVRRGHDVTPLASGDPLTEARLEAAVERPGLAAHIRSRFACVLDDPGATIVDPRAPAKPDEAA